MVSPYQVGSLESLQTDESKRGMSISVDNVHLGLFFYSQLPFGISTLPALWQKVSSPVQKQIITKQVIMY